MLLSRLSNFQVCSARDNRSSICLMILDVESVGWHAPLLLLLKNFLVPGCSLPTLMENFQKLLLNSSVLSSLASEPMVSSARRTAEEIVLLVLILIGWKLIFVLRMQRNRIRLLKCAVSQSWLRLQMSALFAGQLRRNLCLC